MYNRLKDPNKKKKSVFSNLIRTDRFTADVAIHKSVMKNTENYAYYSDQRRQYYFIGKCNSK